MIPAFSARPCALQTYVLLALCVLISALNACTPYVAHEQLTSLNQTVPAGSLFTQRLAVEYRDMANQYNDRFNASGPTAHFSRKGLEAASGENVLPETPNDWWIADDDIDGMHQGRDALIDLLDHGGRDRAPDFSAVAQARYDCWVVEASRIFPGDNQDICRAGFKQAYDDARTQVETPDPVPEIIPQSNHAEEIRAAKFILFFDWNKATVTEAAQKVLDAAMGDIQRLGPAQIDIIGNADKSGTERYNQKLSLERALVVKAKLIEMGVSAYQITAIAHGDDHPLVPTARGVREPANRRVEIYFE